MKLTRLTNQRPASSRKARSIQSGQAGMMRRSAGATKRIAPTATACSNRRGSTGMDLMSSAIPTSAMKKVAPNSTTGAGKPSTTAAVPLTASAADITAMPAPCGVGTRCEERAFGRASA